MFWSEDIFLSYADYSVVIHEYWFLKETGGKYNNEKMQQKNILKNHSVSCVFGLYFWFFSRYHTDIDAVHLHLNGVGPICSIQSIQRLLKKL